MPTSVMAATTGSSGGIAMWSRGVGVVVWSGGVGVVIMRRNIAAAVCGETPSGTADL